MVGAGQVIRTSYLKGTETYQKCDALVYDHLTNRRLHEWASADCLLIDVGKSQAGTQWNRPKLEKFSSKRQPRASRLFGLRRRSFCFGRCAEEMLALDEAQIPMKLYRSNCSSCLCHAGIPYHIVNMARRFAS